MNKQSQRIHLKNLSINKKDKEDILPTKDQLKVN